MSSTHKAYMLRCIAQEPRAMRSFTERAIVSPLAPHIAERYLAEMIAEALIREEDGTYHLTRHGKAVLQRPTSMAEPRVWCAASTKGAYVPPKWEAPRAGADAHRQFRSLGFGA
jgi:hypothetical protein